MKIHLRPALFHYETEKYSILSTCEIAFYVLQDVSDVKSELSTLLV